MTTYSLVLSSYPFQISKVQTTDCLSAPAGRTLRQQDPYTSCTSLVRIPTIRNRKVTMKQQHKDTNDYCLFIDFRSSSHIIFINPYGFNLIQLVNQSTTVINDLVRLSIL